MTSVLSLHFLGEARVLRDGATLALPPSRKTTRSARLSGSDWAAASARAFVLAPVGLPDDPRGALRWSLSKLRGLVNEPGGARNRDRSRDRRFDPRGAHIDIVDLRRRASGGLETAATEDLASLAADSVASSWRDLSSRTVTSFRLVHMRNARSRGHCICGFFARSSRD